MYKRQLGTGSAIGETSVASRAALESTRTALASSRRPFGTALAATVIQSLSGDGVVNGAESNRLGVLTTFDRRLESERLLEPLDLTDDVLADQGDDGAGGAGSAGATGAVQVIGRLCRWVVVDDDGE